MESASPGDCRKDALSQQIKKVFFCDTIPLRNLCDDIVQFSVPFAISSWRGIVIRCSPAGVFLLN